jgi:hypothetical protein
MKFSDIGFELSVFNSGKASTRSSRSTSHPALEAGRKIIAGKEVWTADEQANGEAEEPSAK